MNNIPSKSELRYYRCCYPAGTRIQLDEDMDDPQPVFAGTKGTILAIDDMAQAVMRWDNGRSLSLVLNMDKFHKLQLENNEKLVGHSINGNRNLRSIQDVAEFIMWHGKCGDVEITTECGEPFIKTEGTHLKYVSDAEYRDKLLEIIDTIQQEQEETEELEISLIQG